MKLTVKCKVRMGVGCVLNCKHSLGGVGRLKTVLDNKALEQKVPVYLSEPLGFKQGSADL